MQISFPRKAIVISNTALSANDARCMKFSHSNRALYEHP
ncbi:hypothetical protein T11_17158 [Trichinella zimbabwensis]|uniref:Uncharacterized protein n=1 Tax=Trichinella zimbabwensis TaxID=268475 RepID=A0A0V1GM93_9BILA|nr:hypothetical protein T11_17158 [Trichinella zimbabwensis]